MNMELEYCGATFQFNIQKFHQITKYYLVFIEPNIELRVTSSTFQFNIQVPVQYSMSIYNTHRMMILNVLA